MLEDLKVLLGIPEEDVSQDAKLNRILSAATSRLKVLLGGIDPPEELEYIVTDVAVIRFNRIGSEGLSSHNVEGEIMTFVEDDFSAFRDDIQEWMSAQEGAKKGRVRFI